MLRALNVLGLWRVLGVVRQAAEGELRAAVANNCDSSRKGWQAAGVHWVKACKRKETQSVQVHAATPSPLHTHTQNHTPTHKITHLRVGRDDRNLAQVAQDVAPGGMRVSAQA